ncbi:MAG TPA: TIGR03016 family PEP-CTERM system-associated outer membrane protein [Geobacteraceae bacterium]|nr:TIGR03016 family PEP-CTERM system-associated outer membrane protein [Geobacteraceae bacterium]
MKNCFGRYSAWTVGAAAGLLVCGASVATAADEKFFNPSITVSEEYNDNIFEAQDHRQGEFVTRALPGFVMKYRAPFWDWDLGYTLDYRHYDRGTREDEFTHNLGAKGNLRLVDNFLFLDVNDTYSRISLNVIRDTTTDSLFVNQTDQNIFTLSPYVVFHPASTTSVKTGYRYVKTSYFSSEGIDYEEHGAFLVTTYELSPKSTITATVNYSYDDTDSNLNYSRLTPSLGWRHEYADKSFVSLEGGYTLLFYTGKTTTSPYWNAALTHTFDFVTASVNTGVTYNTDPLLGTSEQITVSGRLDKTLQRGTIGLSALYSELKNSMMTSEKSRKWEVGASVKHELTQKLTGRLNLTGDKYSGVVNPTFVGIAYPYRLFAGAGVSYELKDLLTLSLDYNYITYRNSIESSANSTEVNRVILGVSKVF